MDIKSRIKEFQTIEELTTLENQNVLNELGQCLLFERRMEIFLWTREWCLENEHLGLVYLDAGTAPEIYTRLERRRDYFTR